jgi:hypothetical protein
MRLELSQESRILDNIWFQNDVKISNQSNNFEEYRGAGVTSR